MSTIEAHTKTKQLIPELRFPEFDGEWKEVKLENIFSDFIVPMRDKPTDLTGPIPWCRIEDFSGKYLHESKSGQGVSIETVEMMNLKVYPLNTLLVSCSANLGFCAITKNKLVTNQTFIGLVAKESIIEVDFMYYIMRNSSRKLNALSSGTTISYLSRREFERFHVKTPSLPEQQKIASFLSAVDEKIQQLSRKKELLEQYKKGVMQRIFPSADGQVPQIRFRDENGNDFPDWEEKRLGGICTFFSGGTPSSSKKEYYEGDIPFIGSGDIYRDEVESFITEEALNSSSAKLVENGDLLYALYGANSGEVSISKISGAINQAILCVRSEKISIYYLYFLLLKDKNRIVSKYLQGGQGNLSANIIKKLKYDLPCKEEQIRIAKFLSQMESRINSIKDQISFHSEFKKGLLQKMFV